MSHAITRESRANDDAENEELIDVAVEAPAALDEKSRQRRDKLRPDTIEIPGTYSFGQLRYPFKTDQY
jgi:hypothetical protein